MPCFCWISDDAIEAEMKIIRDHMKEIVKQMKIIHGKGDLHPKQGPLPRNIRDDVHQLIDDLYTGKCDEKLRAKQI